MSKAVEALQQAFIEDPNALHALVVNRVPCNGKLAADRFVVVDEVSVLPLGSWQVGALGLVNAVLAANGLPLVAAKFGEERRKGVPAKMVGFCEHTPYGSPVGAPSQGVVTSRVFQEKWCPERCPITLLPFFMWIEHPEHGWLPTYGGPLDSYTIPEPDVPEGSFCRKDVEYSCLRFDHDEGAWKLGERESVEYRVASEELLMELGAWGPVR